MELSAAEIDRARRGIRAARELLIATYQDRVYAVCCALAADDAYDCAHDALVKVLTELDRFDTSRPVPLGAYIVRIARNVCIDRARSARVSKRVDADVDRIASATMPEHDLEIARRDECVRSAVLALPPDQRAAIALRIWGELDYEHIADIEGVPVGTIRSRLARAREALRASLELEEQIRHAR